MLIKAFDLSSKTGVAAVGCSDGKNARLVFFELIEPWGRNKDAIVGWERWPAARAAFTRHAAGSSLVCIELPMGSKKTRAAEKCLTGLELSIEEACGELGIPILGVSQTVLKLWGTCTLPRGTCDHNVKAKPRTCMGRGNAKKPEMVAAANRLWNINLSDDNVADACLLAGYAAEKNGLILPGCR